MIREWDAEIFYRINSLAGNNIWLDRFGVFAAEWLIFFMIIVLLILAMTPVWKSGKGVCVVCRIFNKKKHHLNPATLSAYAAVVAAFAGILAWISNQLFSLLVLWRHRPFISLSGVNQLIENPVTDKSFPSDHSSVAFAIAFSLVFFRPWLGVGFLVAAIVVAWGRIFVGVHFPADVIAGAMVGGVWAFWAKWLESRSDLSKHICRLYERLCHRLLDK